MFEATTNPDARRAMEDAHAERGRAIASVWGWLFAPKSRWTTAAFLRNEKGRFRWTGLFSC